MFHALALDAPSTISRRREGACSRSPFRDGVALVGGNSINSTGRGSWRAGGIISASAGRRWCRRRGPLMFIPCPTGKFRRHLAGLRRQADGIGRSGGGGSPPTSNDILSPRTLKTAIYECARFTPPTSPSDGIFSVVEFRAACCRGERPLCERRPQTDGLVEQSGRFGCLMRSGGDPRGIPTPDAPMRPKLSAAIRAIWREDPISWIRIPRWL